MPACNFYCASITAYLSTGLSLQTLRAATAPIGSPKLWSCLAGMLWVVVTAHSVVAQVSPAERTVSQNRPTVEERKSRETAKSKGELTFDDIKFDIEKGGKFKRSMITENIEALDKKTIQIRGYILPASVFKQTGIEEFVLVRDNMECCFGPGAALYDCIIVQMEKGKTAEFSTRPIAVKGKFEIKEFTYPDSDEHYAIYKLTASEAK